MFGFFTIRRAGRQWKYRYVTHRNPNQRLSAGSDIKKAVELFCKGHPGTDRVPAGIYQHLREVEAKLRPGETLLASSDIIESIFGKYKLLVERSPQKAITRLILTIGALASQRTFKLVQSAMKSVKTTAVARWFSQYVAESVSTLRQKAFA